MKIDPEFRDLIAPLSEAERRQLEDNLIAHGCRDPLVTWRGILIDGHNRHEICMRLSIKYRVIEIDLPSRAHVLVWMDQNQLGRRNLTDDQRGGIAMRLKKRLSALLKTERAKAGGNAKPRIGRKEDSLQTTVAHKLKIEPSRTQAAKTAKVSERKIRQIEALEKDLGPAIVDEIVSGEITVAKAKRKAKEQEREKRVEEAQKIASVTPMPERCQLLSCDLADAKLDADSVHAIITDPPYPKEFLPVFQKLITVAAHCLKPGGSALVMCGQSYLPEIYRVLASDTRLSYQWTLAYLTPGGQSAQLWDRKVNTFWKPLLWLVKGKYAGDWVGDVLKSQTNDNDKRFHEWGQSESGIAQLVERFSLPGQTILDPFCGGGTTGFVALKLGRSFVGIDADQTAIDITRARLRG